MTASLIQFQEPRRYQYGIPEDAEPPNGYSFTLSAGGILVLVDQDGREFYACRDGDHWNLTPKFRATIWDKIRTFGRFKIGTEYADTRKLIRIPA